jgi:hypothetical protein
VHSFLVKLKIRAACPVAYAAYAAYAIKKPVAAQVTCHFHA